MIDGLRVTKLEGDGNAVALALEQCELALDLHRACLQIFVKRLVETASYLNEKPVVDAHLQLNLMALDEIVSVLVRVGYFRHAPMIGAAIFDLDLALLDPRFLD